MEETLKQLEVTLPATFEGMASRNVLKFNTSDCERIFGKMCEAKNMEEVFHKLDRFEAQSEMLKDLNKRSEASIEKALNEAKDCLDSLRFDKKKDIESGIKEE